MTGSLDVSTAVQAAAKKIQDEGVALPDRAALDFVGAGVDATDGPGDKTTVTIPGGSGTPAGGASLELLDDSGLLAQSASHVVNFAPALDWLRDYAKLIVIIRGESTATLSLDMRVNGVNTLYVHQYIRAIGATLTAVQAIAQAQAVLGSQAMITSANDIFSYVEITCTQGTSGTRPPHFWHHTDFAGQKFEEGSGNLGADHPTCTSIEVLTGANDMRANWQVQIYGVKIVP